jgi:D-alanyl-D-alanine carboxypeptidase
VIPASAQKLVVAAVALEQLGESFTYTTTVASASAPTAGVVDGDLYLVGGGDPLLSSDWYPESGLERFPVTSPTSLDSLADDVAAAGITTVTGGVIGDGSRYDDEFFAPGWGVGVAGLEGGPYDALLVNDARVLGEERVPTTRTPRRLASSSGCWRTAVSTSPARRRPVPHRRRWSRSPRSSRRRCPTWSPRCSATATTTPPSWSSRNSA